MATTREPTAVEVALIQLNEAVNSGDDAAIEVARQAVADAKAARDAGKSTFGQREHPCYWSTCAGMFLTAESAKLHGGFEERIEGATLPDGVILGDRDYVLIHRHCTDGQAAMTAARTAKRFASK